MAKKGIEQELLDAQNAWEGGKVQEAMNILNRLRATAPLVHEVGYGWCHLALRMGQPEAVPAYAAQLYAAERAPLKRAGWARFAGAASFKMIRLEDAVRDYTVGLAHCCEAAENGKAPARQEKTGHAPMFADGTADALLWRIAAELAAAGFQAFPHAGTLLGLVREGCLLRNDKDVDLAIWIEDFEACCSHLLANGWKAVNDHLPYSNFRSFVDPKTRLVVDMCGMRREPERQRMLSGFFLDKQPPEYQRVTVYPWLTLALRDSPAGQVWFPDKPEELLEALYGDWRTPNAEWDTIISACNLERFTLQVRAYAYNRLLDYWLQGQLDRAYQYARQILQKDADDLVVIRAHAVLAAIQSSSGTVPSAKAAVRRA